MAIETYSKQLATLTKSHMGEKGTSIRIETCQLRPPLRLLCTKQEDPVRIVMWIITCNKTPFSQLLLQSQISFFVP